MGEKNAVKVNRKDSHRTPLMVGYNPAPLFLNAPEGASSHLPGRKALQDGSAKAEHGQCDPRHLQAEIAKESEKLAGRSFQAVGSSSLHHCRDC